MLALTSVWSNPMSRVRWWFVLLFIMPPAVAAPMPDVILKGTLSGADNHSYRLVPFTVPAGTTRITVDFDYTTRDQRTTIDLGMLGPDGFHRADGFRGWSGGNKRTFTIAASDATPSYLPGPLEAGQWSLLLGIPNIRADTRAEFTATVHFDFIAAPVLKAEAGWYRGDLHMHTAHSDGSCVSRLQKQRVPCPLFLTAQAASARGLDFIAITDHNTISHAEPVRELQPYFDDLLLIAGREITTFQGHANLFGSVASLDFRVGSTDVPDWSALLAHIERTKGVLSINHPVRPSGEQCMGCGWTPSVAIDPARVQAVEVVNGRDADTEFSGIPFWEKWLNAGYVITAVGGSDNHDALLPDGIGTPTTVVYADSLSEPGIVAALRRGRIFIDVAGTRDRALDLTATLGEQQAHMGDQLRVKRGDRVKFSGHVDGVAGGKVEVILDARRAQLLSANESFTFDWRADGKSHWIRLNVRDGAGHLALVGNPVYLRP
jgi:predicted metal-dependent phosphoesterase TrpH